MIKVMQCFHSKTGLDQDRFQTESDITSVMPVHLVVAAPEPRKRGDGQDEPAAGPKRAGDRAKRAQVVFKMFEDIEQQDEIARFFGLKIGVQGCDLNSIAMRRIVRGFRVRFDAFHLAETA